MLLGLIAVSLFGIMKLSGRWMETVFQQEILSLGYEIPGAKEMIALKKTALKSALILWFILGVRPTEPA